MRYYVYVDGERVLVELEEGRVRAGGEDIEIELAPNGGGAVRSVRVGGRSPRAIPRRNGRGEWSIDLEGARYRVEVLDRGQEAAREAGSAREAAAGPSPLKAPMPGLIIAVAVEVGQEVEAGDNIVILESMKMENELKTPRAGRVERVTVSDGDSVEQNQTLVVIV